MLAMKLLSLHDTLSRKRQEVLPSDGKVFRFYCCGPTVYGPAHIGNFRTFLVQDLLRRVVELSRPVTSAILPMLMTRRSVNPSLPVFRLPISRPDGQRVSMMMPGP